MKKREGLIGPQVESFSVGAWCPNQTGTGPATAVAITIGLKDQGDLVLRLKTPERVDEIIRLLRQYKNEVWPQDIPDGQHQHGSVR